MFSLRSRQVKIAFCDRWGLAVDWWDLGEWSGTSGNKLALYQITCAFCGVKGNLEITAHLERQKPGGGRKVLNYDTLKCGNCGNYMFAFWSAAAMNIGGTGIHSYRLLPWHQSTTEHPEHWPGDVGRYWIEARRSLEGKNWTAAALMARSAVQLVARAHGAKGKNLKEEIDDLAAKGKLLPVMQEWAHEVRELGNEGTHPKPGTAGTNEKDAKDVVEYLGFLMQVLYDLPHQIEQYRARKS
jgi:hypothetical protein